MADSDDTTTLSSVTRRMLLTCTMATMATLPFGPGTESVKAFATNKICDPALDVWRQWFEAFNETQRLWKLQLDLERRMVAAIGFPHVEIMLPGEMKPVRAFSLEEVDRICGDASGHEAIRASAIASFRNRQDAWNRLDDALGYTRAAKAEVRADRTEMMTADALMSTPAATLAGVAGKLDAVLRKGEYYGSPPDFPWQHVRSAQADLIRIGQTLQPNLFMFGSGAEIFLESDGDAL